MSITHIHSKMSTQEKEDALVRAGYIPMTSELGDGRAWTLDVRLEKSPNQSVLLYSTDDGEESLIDLAYRALILKDPEYVDLCDFRHEK